MKNIALWGLGAHSIRNTLPALKQCKSIRLIGAYTRNRQVLEEIVDKHQIRTWPSADEMLNDEQVDIVYIASPVGMHYSQIKTAIKKGKHVFCEKALVEGYNKAEELFDLAQRQGVVLAECFMYLYHTQFTALRQFIADGIIGDVHSVYARFGYPHLNQDNVRYDRELGGGALLDAGVYPLSALAHLGSHSLHGFCGDLFYTEEFDVDVRGGCFARSGQISFHGEWGMGRDYCNEIEIWGSNGKLIVERAFSKPPELETKIVSVVNGERTEHLTGSDNHFINMFEAFSKLDEDKEGREMLKEKSLLVAELVSKLTTSVRS